MRAGLRSGLSSRKMPQSRAASRFSRRFQQLDGADGTKNTLPWLVLLIQAIADLRKYIFVFPKQQT